MAQPLGQPLGQPKFKVLKALGKGSYGTVYKVQRLEDGGVYAMKETDLSRMGPKERADAVNEIRVLGSMHHPNVVRHHETFVSGAKLCIVMEFAPAGDLSSFLKAAAASRLPLPEATVWQIFLQLCQGMQAIHETCVIHRDIKPANIFMCPGNIVKVGDLGVAKALTRAAHAQTVIGTPLYMAPEVWRGLRYSYSSDLWSLGTVLYEMMAHRLPFDARSLGELKNKIILGSFAPLAPGAPYSAALVGVAHALLSKDPARRPTCAAILNSREAAPWLHTLPEAVRLPLPPLDASPCLGVPALGGGGANAALLPTIQVPRDIRLLPHRLPKPNYAAEAATPAAGRPDVVRNPPAAGVAPGAAAVRAPGVSPRQAPAPGVGAGLSPRLQAGVAPSARGVSPSPSPYYNLAGQRGCPGGAAAAAGAGVGGLFAPPPGAFFRPGLAQPQHVAGVAARPPAGFNVAAGPARVPSAGRVPGAAAAGLAGVARGAGAVAAVGGAPQHPAGKPSGVPIVAAARPAARGGWPY